MIRTLAIGCIAALSALGAARTIASLDDSAQAAPAPRAAVAVQAPVRPAPAQVAKGPDGHYWAQADVNGKAVRFLVDTGATAVALTADAFRDTRDRLLAAGMDAYLTKPLQLHDLQQELAACGGRTDLDGGATAATEPLPAAHQEPAPPAAPVTPARRHRFRAGDVGQMLDMAVIGELCVGLSLDGYRGLLRDFLSDDQGALAALRTALAAGRSDELKARGHAVKGTAGSLGLAALQAQARRIELEGPVWSAEDCTPQAQALDELLDRTRALVQRMGLG